MKKFYNFLLVIVIVFVITGIIRANDSDLIFSHQFHSSEVEAPCAACHQAAETSENPADNLLPAMETCFTCHSEGDTECSVCHKDPENIPEEYPRITDYIAKFPHKKHIDQSVECLTCHTGVEKSETVAEKHIPGMATCQNCHSDLEKVDYCYDCHATTEDLAPEDHKTDWQKAHGPASLTQLETCQSCHVESQCAECHLMDDLDHVVHPLNYVNSHGIYAKNNKDNCLTCHEELAFCYDCHRQQNVMPRNHASAGWSNFKTGGRHASEARYDLDNCITCHNDNLGEPVCKQCHVE